MKALVIYDSFFGNTEKIAQAIAYALGDPENVILTRVNDVSNLQLQGAEMIVVGSPTRAFKPSKAITDFLGGIPGSYLNGKRAAAFDTRIQVAQVNSRILTTFVRIFGYAAEPIAKALKKKGAELVVPSEGFFVNDREGPIKDGELERAAEWAQSLVM